MSSYDRGMKSAFGSSQKFLYAIWLFTCIAVFLGILQIADHNILRPEFQIVQLLLQLTAGWLALAMIWKRFAPGTDLTHGAANREQKTSHVSKFLFEMSLLFFGTLLTAIAVCICVVPLPQKIVHDNGEIIYFRAGFPDEDNCMTFLPASWLTMEAEAYPRCRDAAWSSHSLAVSDLPDTASESYPASQETPSATDSVALEPTAPPLFPTDLAEDDLIQTVPLEHPTKDVTNFGVFAYKNQFYGALKVNGSWLASSAPIAPLGMDGEIYSMFAADQNLLALGPASANGGQTFYSYDGGATWQEFKPEGIDSTQNSQTFLEDLKKTSTGYEIDLNYPSWVTNPGEPDRFVSTDGVQWEKK